MTKKDRLYFLYKDDGSYEKAEAKQMEIESKGFRWNMRKRLWISPFGSQMKTEQASMDFDGEEPIELK